MFLPRVCLSTEGWGVGFPACITGHMTRGGGSAYGGGLHPGEGDLHPGGRGSAYGGVCIQGDWADSPATGTGKEDSTHPTAMLPCLCDTFVKFTAMKNRP